MPRPNQVATTSPDWLTVAGYPTSLEAQTEQLTQSTAVHRRAACEVAIALRDLPRPTKPLNDLFHELTASPEFKHNAWAFACSIGGWVVMGVLLLTSSGVGK